MKTRAKKRQLNTQRKLRTQFVKATLRAVAEANERKLAPYVFSKDARVARARGAEDVVRARRIAKASAYLDATREEFIADVARATQRLYGAETGMWAGPIANTLRVQEPND